MEATSAPKKVPLHFQIFIGLAVGAVAGLLCNTLASDAPWLAWTIDNVTATIGQVFLRLIFMTVVPLIFCALTLGVAELGDMKQLGRIGMKTLVFTLVMSAMSVMIGIGLVNVFQPGIGLDEEQHAALAQTITTDDAKSKVELAAQAKPFTQTLLEIIPRNPLQDAVGTFDPNYSGGGILSVMFFALVTGIALAMVRSEKTEAFEKALQGFYEIVMKIIDLAMRLAPIGVAALIFGVTARLGLDIVWLLGKYVLIVLAGLVLHTVVVYSAVLRFGAKVSPLWFFRQIQGVMLTAFSTSSSNATLPTSLKVSEENIGVPRHINNFVLTLGSTANQNGTALYEGITVLFLAQFFGVDLTFSQQLTVMLASILAGVGTAGVPGGSMPVVVLVLQSVGIPGEGIGIILGVDRVLDMSRTVVNVTGDLVVAASVARSEGHELNEVESAA